MILPVKDNQIAPWPEEGDIAFFGIKAPVSARRIKLAGRVDDLFIPGVILPSGKVDSFSEVAA